MSKPPCPIDEGNGPCGRTHYAFGLCSMHYKRQWKHGDPRTVATGYQPSGQSHYNWGGNDVRYNTQHGRIERVRGKASLYRCDTCERQAYNWAFIHSGKWNNRFNIWDYRAMCCPCHHRYDDVDRKMWETRWRTNGQA